MKRLFFGIFLIISTFILPWWLAILLGIIGLFYFNNLYEIIVVGLLIDVLYGQKYEIWGFSLIFTVSMTVCFYLIGKFKKQILI